MSRLFGVFLIIFVFERFDNAVHLTADRLHPDVNLNATQLIQKYGYPVEVHTVITEDGYILEMHRIPYGKKSPEIPGVKRPVAFLQVGLWCSSAAWVDMGPEKALAYLVADRGYDVWIGNNRGTTYSRQHVTLNPDKGKAFWNFSWHEMGVYDLPAMIDYALKVTEQEQIHYIGHSQGATTFMVFLSERPEYNSKIKIAVTLAPATILTHMKNPFGRILANNLSKLQLTLKLLGINELMPNTPFLQELGKTFCNDDAPTQDQCALVFFLFAGFDSDQLNKTMIPVITTNTPAGSSVKQFVHYLQAVNSHKFQQYDYGKIRNRVIYGTDNPPEYDPTKITAPIAVFFADNDWLVSEEDLMEFTDQLPNMVHRYRVRYPNFNHIDFIWAIDVVPLLYDEVFRVMDQYL